MNEGTKRSERTLPQWPYKLGDVPSFAPYLSGAEITIAADCVAYAYDGFRREVGRDDVLLIGCARDSRSHIDRLSGMISANGIRAITLLRMEVGCCDGLERAVKRAIELSGESVEFREKIISTDGKSVKDA